MSSEYIGQPPNQFTVRRLAAITDNQIDRSLTS